MKGKIMKARHFIIASIVALPFLAACSDDDYNVITPAGNPQIAAFLGKVDFVENACVFVERRMRSLLSDDMLALFR